MDLKEKMVSSFLAFENEVQVDTETTVHEIRSEAIKKFEDQGFPSKKDEEWKYTSLNSLLRKDYSLFVKEVPTVAYEEVKRYFIHDTESYKLVFIDGVFSSFLSETTHEGYDICVLSSALTKPEYKSTMDTYFNKSQEIDTALSNLNTAFATEGAYINIPKNKVLPKPIQLLFFTTGKNKDVIVQPRNLVVVGENAQVQIYERHQNLSGDASFSNSVTEIFVAENAIMDYYKLQNDEHEAALIDHTFVTQKKQSTASVHTFSFGGKLIRNNLSFFQEGSYCESNLNGISLLSDNQHVDHHTLVAHNYPNCVSNELYKGIFDDKSTGVFNGKVIVHQEAQKINAFQQNNNLLIGDRSSVNTKPQLEIFADDVKCSHGCTIGQLDKDALFYMKQRGIPEKEAKALLLYAFAHEALNNVKIPELKAKINAVIAKKLNVKMGFDL